MHSHPETPPEFWHYYFLPPRIPSSSLLQLHLIHSSAAAVIWSASWLTSSHHICSFLIKYEIAFHNCHFHCCSFLVSICYSNQTLLAPYVSNPSFCTTILLLTSSQIFSFLENNIEITAIGQFWPSTWKTQCVFLKFLRVSVCRDKNQHTLVFTAKNVAQTPEIKGLRQYVLIGTGRLTSEVCSSVCSNLADVHAI